MILNCSTPWVKDVAGNAVADAPHEVILNVDGTTTLAPRPAPQDYDPREYPWFKDAMTTTNTVWSRPYDFDEGVRALRRAARGE